MAKQKASNKRKAWLAAMGAHLGHSYVVQLCHSPSSAVMGRLIEADPAFLTFCDASTIENNNTTATDAEMVKVPVGNVAYLSQLDPSFVLSAVPN